MPARVLPLLVCREKMTGHGSKILFGAEVWASRTIDSVYLTAREGGAREREHPPAREI